MCIFIYSWDRMTAKRWEAGMESAGEVLYIRPRGNRLELSEL